MIAVSANGTPVTGSPVSGNRIDATPGTWSRDPNQSFITYAYHWEDCDSSGAKCTPIGGRAGRNPYYYITGNDVGHTIEVAVSATNNANTEGPVHSAATALVAGPKVPVITILKLNPSTWNAAGSSVITYYDSEAATSTLKVFQNGTVIRTSTHKDTAKHYGGNGIKLAGLPAGSYQLQVTPNNQGTAGHTTTINFVVTSALPVITRAKVNPSSFNASRGATVTYLDSQPGHATLSVLKCRSNKQKPKKGKRHTTKQHACTKLIKTIRHRDRAGANGVKLTGVPAGHYQLQIASNYAGLKGAPVLTPFTAKTVRGKRHTVQHRASDLAFSPAIFAYLAQLSASDILERNRLGTEDAASTPPVADHVGGATRRVPPATTT
jgi:hypothetical protein